jgi:acetaldehyde dehydrogenase/alcohol dehydrogenase
MGVVLGITPVTNPTSTAIFKALIAIKTRNAIVLCPHPRSANWCVVVWCVVVCVCRRVCVFWGVLGRDVCVC